MPRPSRPSQSRTASAVNSGPLSDADVRWNTCDERAVVLVGERTSSELSFRRDVDCRGSPVVWWSKIVEQPHSPIVMRPVPSDEVIPNPDLILVSRARPGCDAGAIVEPQPCSLGLIRRYFRAPHTEDPYARADVWFTRRRAMRSSARRAVRCTHGGHTLGQGSRSSPSAPLVVRLPWHEPHAIVRDCVSIRQSSSLGNSQPPT